MHLKMRSLILAAVAMTALGAALVQPAAASSPGGETFEREDGAQVFLNRFIVGVSGDYSAEKAQAIADRHGAALQMQMRFVRMVVLTTAFTTRAEHDRFLLELSSDPDVRFAEPDVIFAAIPSPDPFRCSAVGWD